MIDEYGIAEFELDALFVISVILLIPYFAWGVYTLVKRFQHHEELNPIVEIITVAALVVYYAIELALLRASLGPANVYLFLSAAGLFLSGLALYGHILVSLLSNLAVGVFMPTGRRDLNQPLYGAAEAREQQGDYEGAASEYRVIARTFPKDPKAAIRLGDVLVRLGRPEEAADWFEKGLANLDSPDESLSIAFRLSEIYDRELKRTEDAKQVLKRYLESYPETQFASSIEQRLERIKNRKQNSPV